MKKFSSLFVAVLLVLNSFIMLASAENNELTAAEMHDQLCQMIYENEGLQTSSPGTYYPTNRLLVKTDSNEHLEENYGAIDCVEGYKGIHIFQYDSINKTEIAYQNFLNDNIECVEYDFYFEIDSNTEMYSEGSQETSSHLSWNSDVVQVDEAFEFINQKNTECEPVTVAILDTELYAEHEYFDINRIIDSGYARKDDETRESYPSLIDDENHGTHVAGIIYDNTMDNVVLCPYRVIPMLNFCTYSVTWAAFQMAVEKGADVVNISLSGQGGNETDENGEKYCNILNQAITDATNDGVLVVVGAGNKRGNADYNYPACCPEAITVAATDKRNLPDVSYSASGKCVDIAAPGTNINSTVPRLWSTTDVIGYDDRFYDPIPSSLYREMSGTSMATPLVSALAATVKSIAPDITASEFERLLKDTAYIPDNWEEGSYGKNYGVGIVNFYNMVKIVLEPETSCQPLEIKANNGKIEIIAPEGSDARIYYTIDGSVPTVENHIKYTEPVSFRNNYIKKIIAVCHENGKLISEPITYGMIKHRDKTIFCKWSKTLTTNENSGKATWYSRNPEIATVDENGKITGVSPGNTDIVCRYPTGERVTWNIKVQYSPIQLFFIICFFGFLWN